MTRSNAGGTGKLKEVKRKGQNWTSNLSVAVLARFS